MLTQLYMFTMTLVLQGSADSPPVPKMGPAPPVGDPVPIDESVVVLVLVAICLGVWHLYSSRVKDFKGN